jgi:enoyl-CoA hydratase
MKTIEIIKSNKICVITLNREKSMNAINSVLLDELSSVIDNLDNQRVVVFKGKGKAFSGGADIKEISKMSSLEIKNFSKKGQKVFNKIQELNKLTIASINGYCIGGGLELASSCDLRICSSFSRFGLPELKLGVIPGFGAFYRVQQIIGISELKNLLFNGKIINAKYAEKIGLVNEVVEDVEKKLDLIIKNFLNNFSYNAFIKAKTLLNQQNKKQKEKILELEKKFITECFLYPDKKEGMNAFLEKRKPEFK